MAGLYHDFIAANDTEINEFALSGSFNILEFMRNKESIKIHDDFIQLLMNKKYLPSVQSYDYTNKKIINGLCPYGLTIFHSNQIDQLYEKICLFETEIDLRENFDKMAIFSRKKKDVLENVQKLKQITLYAKKNMLGIYHNGI